MIFFMFFEVHQVWWQLKCKTKTHHLLCGFLVGDWCSWGNTLKWKTTVINCLKIRQLMLNPCSYNLLKRPVNNPNTQASEHIAVNWFTTQAIWPFTWLYQKKSINMKKSYTARLSKMSYHTTLRLKSHTDTNFMTDYPCRSTYKINT
jgi:hypothetical protein